MVNLFSEEMRKASKEARKVQKDQTVFDCIRNLAGDESTERRFGWPDLWNRRAIYTEFKVLCFRGAVH